MAPSQIDHVTVHPLVMLSVVDHYNRVAKDTNKRVVGVLLGYKSKGTLEVTNSFAVPFEEDEKDPSIWFLDHNFMENMFSMFKKVTAKEKIIGWYSSGPKIRRADLDIHELFRSYTPEPVYVILNVKPKDLGIPSDAYVSVEELEDEASEPKLAFKHIPCELGALEAEEVGVEHLLRDIKDTTISDLASNVGERLSALKALHSRLKEIYSYLNDVVDGKYPINHNIMYGLQDVFNLLPNLKTAENQQSMVTQTNDTMLVLYLSSVIRSIVALHNLVNNKRDLKEVEDKQREDKRKEKKKEKKQEKSGSSEQTEKEETKTNNH
eukprot:gb/GECH01008633.1/.p1 GENE.gb/GECH01008633.1/~~gb/GECH01008633.1/.p1  ORF type:complete len:322 (+),score=82.18 gb/GECH01008633.1/:1-966(+)